MEVLEPRRERIVSTNADAIALLRDLQSGAFTLRPETPIIFDGWPTLYIRVNGARLDSALTSEMMKGYLELQTAINRAYAVAAYGVPNPRRLTDAERDELQIIVRVASGSSEQKAELQSALQRIVELSIGKMSSNQIVAALIAAGFLYSAQSAWSEWLDHKNNIAAQESELVEERLRSDERRFLIGSQRRELETFREAVSGLACVNDVQEQIDRGREGLLRRFNQPESFSIAGTAIDDETAAAATLREPTERPDRRLTSIFNVRRVVIQSDEEARVTLQEVGSHNNFRATIRDQELEAVERELLKEAEWQRLPLEVELLIIAGDTDDVEILSVKRPSRDFTLASR